MRHRIPAERRCTYLVAVDEPLTDVRNLAEYLSEINVADCDVIVVDSTPLPHFQTHRRALRWVGRHISARPKHFAPDGSLDPVRAALDLAPCEKIVVAGPNVRYDDCALDELCSLLEAHEIVEPQDYFDPLPWWGSIEAGRMLVHRGVDPLPDHGATFGFRRGALRGLRTIDVLDSPSDDHVRRLAAVGAEVHSAINVFVKRIPPPLSDWLDQRPRQAVDDFSLPMKTAFFLALIPIAMLLAAFGGGRVVGGYAGAIAFGAFALALRGRAGAAAYFPIRACLAAPLWVLERAVSVYWALFWKLRQTIEPDPAVADPLVRPSATFSPHAGRRV